MDPAPQVVVRRSARRRRTVTAYRERDAIVVLLPERMSQRDEQRYVDEMVKKVLAREARSSVRGSDDQLAERAAVLSKQYLGGPGSPAPVPVRVSWVDNQHQRWGSCTPSTGTIRLSSRLRAMPAWVVDYVLLHELAHLLESGHGPRFWALVDQYPPAERAKGFLEGWVAAASTAGVAGSATEGTDRPDTDVSGLDHDVD